MELPPVIPEIPEFSDQAARIAAAWGLPLSGDTSHRLVYTGERLELRQSGSKAPGPVYVDFTTGAVDHRRRFGGGRGQPMAKAAGFGKGGTPSIIDATAGLGRDAFVFATLGSEVSLIERSPVAAALLEDGLRRAVQHDEVAPIVARMRLCVGSAAERLPGMSADVVYLDPMFPHREKSAQVKKEMAALQAVVGSDPDADALLEPALAAARMRVVVKRPARAGWLGGRKPTVVYETKKHRFDVYVLAAM